MLAVLGELVALVGLDAVVAAAAVDPVLAAATHVDPVVARQRAHAVVARTGLDPVVSGSAEDVIDASFFLTAGDRVYAVLPDTPEDAITVKVIGDRLVADDTGKGPMKADTIRKALNRDLEGRVDVLEGRWWRI